MVPLPSPAALTWRHLLLTVAGGAVLAVPLALGLSWLMQPSPHRLQAALSEWGAMCLLLAGGGVLPAWAVALLRLPLMRWLFGQCLARGSARAGQVLAVAGTLAIFEGVLVLLVVLVFGWQHSYFSLTGWLRISQWFGMPWLLAALWASWHVLQPLQAVGRRGARA